MTDGTYYLIFEKNMERIEINEPITYNINNNNITIKWIKDENFNCYYYEELLYRNEMVRQHTIRLIKNLEVIYKCKIKYRLTKRVVLEKADPDTIGFVY